MSFVSTSLLAFSMSVDAFAASLAQGARLKRPRIGSALRTGLLFGVIEGITPVIGWCVGITASSYIAAVDHWVAFAILSALGLKMIFEGIGTPAETLPQDAPGGKGVLRLALLAFATSLDAMAVGVTLGVMGMDILLSSLAIAFATFVMTTAGILIGHYASGRLGKYTEVAGGVVLIVIGAVILMEHLSH